MCDRALFFTQKQVVREVTAEWGDKAERERERSRWLQQNGGDNIERGKETDSHTKQHFYMQKLVIALGPSRNCPQQAHKCVSLHGMSSGGGSETHQTPLDTMGPGWEGREVQGQ